MKSIDENIIKLDLFCFIILLDFQISFWLLLFLFVNEILMKQDHPRIRMNVAPVMKQSS